MIGPLAVKILVALLKLKMFPMNITRALGSLAGALEENNTTLESTATATQVKPKASKKSNGGVKSKKRKNTDEEDGSVSGISPSATKSDDDGGVVR